MATIGLMIYSFYLEQKNSKRKAECKRLKLNNPIGGYNNFIGFVKHAFSNHGHDDDETRKKIFKFISADISQDDNKDYIHCMIKAEVGKYGESATIEDSMTHKQTYSKQPKEAVLQPLYVSVIIDKQEKITKGFVIFQTLGSSQLKSYFEQYVQDSLNQIFTDNKVKLRLYEVLPRDYAKKVLKENDIKSISLIAYREPQDHAAKLDDFFKYQTEERIYKRFQRIDKVLNRLIDILDNKAGLTHLVELGDFKFDNIKVDVGGKTINFEKIDKIKNKISLPEGIKGEDGHPVKDLLKDEIENMYELYANSINLI